MELQLVDSVVSEEYLSIKRGGIESRHSQARSIGGIGQKTLLASQGIAQDDAGLGLCAHLLASDC